MGLSYDKPMLGGFARNKHCEGHLGILGNQEMDKHIYIFCIFHLFAQNWMCIIGLLQDKRISGCIPLDSP